MTESYETKRKDNFFKEKNICYKNEEERIYERKKQRLTIYSVANRKGRRKQFFKIQIGEESRCRN